MNKVQPKTSPDGAMADRPGSKQHTPGAQSQGASLAPSAMRPELPVAVAHSAPATGLSGLAFPAGKPAWLADALLPYQRALIGHERAIIIKMPHRRHGKWLSGTLSDLYRMMAPVPPGKRADFTATDQQGGAA